MAGERDVLVNLGIKPLPGSEKPMNDLTASTGKADKAVHALTMKLRTEIMELKRGGEAAKAFTRDTQGWTKAQIEGTAALEKQIQTLKKRQQFLSMPSGPMGGMGAVGLAGGKVIAGAMVAKEGMDLVGDFANMGNPDHQNTSRIGQLADSMAQSFFSLERATGLNITGMNRLAEAAEKAAKAEENRTRQINSGTQQAGIFNEKTDGGLGIMRGQSDLQADLANLRKPGSGLEGQIADRRTAIEQSQRQIAELQKPAGNEERRTFNRIALVGEQERLKQLQQEMLGLEKQRLDQMKMEGQERVRSMQQQADAMKQQVQQLDQIAKMERERLASLKEQFGFMRPEEQQAIKDIAKKLAGGEQLSADELGFAQGKGQFFGKQLREIGGAAGDRAGFDDVVKMLGLDNKAKEAEAQKELLVKAEVELRNKIEIEVKANADEISARITEKIEPLVKALAAQIETAILGRLRNADIQRAVNR